MNSGGQCHLHRASIFNNDTGNKIGDIKVESEPIYKKALTRVSGVQMELFDEENQRSKIS
jgi:hypothetical protein